MIVEVITLFKIRIFILFTTYSLFTVYPAWLTSPALSSISNSSDSDSGEAFTAVRAYSSYTYEKMNCILAFGIAQC